MTIGNLDFNSFDIVVLLIIFISLAMAASRGLFRELIAIASLVGALIASLFVWGRFRFAAQSFIQPDEIADLVLGAGTFVIAYLIISFVLNGATKGLRGKKVGLLDRLTGAGFGALRGLIVCSLFTMLMTANYREAKDMQAFKQTMTPEQRELLQDAPKNFRALLNEDEEPQLPGMLQNSTLYPLLDRVGGVLRALPIARWKTMAEKLKDGAGLGEVISRD